MRLLLLAALSVACASEADRDATPRADAGAVADTFAPVIDSGAPPSDTSAADTGRTPLPTDPVEVSIGYLHTCARTHDGHVRCWGPNKAHELGDGTTDFRKTPTDVPGLSNVAQIAAMHYNTCARIADGTVKCWGQLGWGLTGDGRTDMVIPVPTPTTIPKLVGVTQVGGSGHACAQLEDKSVMCWGYNPFGELGYATTTPALGSDYTCAGEPATVPGLTGVTSLAAGVQHNCALTAHGVWCWGWNESGQLGDGTTISRHEPKLVVGLTDAVQISVHHSISCALRATGAVACWGARYRDIYGYAVDKMKTPYEVGPFAGPVAEVVAGGPRRCVRLKDGRVQCWGTRLDGSFEVDDKAALVEDLDHVVSLAVGNGRVCAIKDDATMWCWGDVGVIGAGLGDALGTERSTVPVRVAW